MEEIIEASPPIKLHRQRSAYPPAREKHTLPRRLSISSQDLRRLNIMEGMRDAAKLDEFSPGGVLDERLRCSEAEAESSGAAAEGSFQFPWRVFLRLWRRRSMRRLATFPRMGIPRLPRGWSSRVPPTPRHDCCGNDAEVFFFKPSWKSFTFSELQKATHSFNPENIIGKGGCSEVYKGRLENGQFVAIKKLTRGTTDERTRNFLSELGIIVHVDHPNTAKLIGFGVEGGMYLVLQLSPHGCLASLLHGSNQNLDWNIRYKIAIGTAKGLDYLHERCQRRIIHRDIKSANILLTENFEAQICDFGLAKWLPDKWTHHTVSTFEGTFGYLAPEYIMHGIVNEKTDVFSFGVLLLELISGRKAVDSSHKSLVMWATPLLEKNNIRDLVDPSISNVYDHTQLRRIAKTASLCIQKSSILRPCMCQVLKLLGGDEEKSNSIEASQVILHNRTYSPELFDAEDNNATSYLSDLKQHKQLALDF